MIDAHFHLLNSEIDKTLDYAKPFDFLFCMCYPYPEYDIMSLNEGISFSEKNSKFKIIASINFNKSLNPQLKEIDKYMSLKKVFGVKIYPGCQHINPSDKRMYEVAKLCIKHNLPLIFHSGVTDDCPYAIEDYNRPLHVDILCIKFPKLKVILAHIGYPYTSEIISMLLKHDNIYTDLSGLIHDDADKGYAVSILKKIKEIGTLTDFKKFIFGSDYPGITNSSKFIKQLKSVIPKNIHDLVFDKTARKLFNL